jgi:hypothetical protein
MPKSLTEKRGLLLFGSATGWSSTFSVFSAVNKLKLEPNILRLPAK